jgi:hypothetical protein
MSMLMFCSIVLSMLFQTGSLLPAGSNIFNAEEKLKFEKATDVNGRIKIYQRASERIVKDIEATVAKDDFQSTSADLKKWISLLDESLKDIEANLKSKKISKDLKHYEIHLRKAISRIGNYKTKAPVDQFDLFESCLKKAEATHTRFVDILFKRE